MLVKEDHLPRTEAPGGGLAVVPGHLVAQAGPFFLVAGDAPPGHSQGHGKGGEEDGGGDGGEVLAAGPAGVPQGFHVAAGAPLAPLQGGPLGQEGGPFQGVASAPVVNGVARGQLREGDEGRALQAAHLPTRLQKLGPGEGPGEGVVGQKAPSRQVVPQVQIHQVGPLGLSPAYLLLHLLQHGVFGPHAPQAGGVLRIAPLGVLKLLAPGAKLLVQVPYEAVHHLGHQFPGEPGKAAHLLGEGLVHRLEDPLPAPVQALRQVLAEGGFEGQSPGQVLHVHRIL